MELSRIVSWCKHAEPLVQAYAAIKPLYVYAGLVEPCPRSLTTFLCALIRKLGKCAAVKVAAPSYVLGEHLIFPFNEMMPRGPGILSVRDA